MKNKEFRRGFWLMSAGVLMFSVIGFCVSAVSGLLVLVSGSMATAIYVWVEGYRYRKLQRLRNV